MQIAALLITCSLLFVTTAFAQESTASVALTAQSIGSSSLSPENPLYFLKAVREILEIKFAGTEMVRVLKRLEFAQRRLREVSSLTVLHREDLIAPNTEKFLLEVSLIRPVKDKSMHPVISGSLGHYMEALVALYGNLTDPKAKRAVRSAIYRLMDLNSAYYTSFASKLSKPLFESQAAKFSAGCLLLSREASVPALNESERQVLAERGVKCGKVIEALYLLPQTEE